MNSTPDASSAAVATRARMNRAAWALALTLASTVAAAGDAASPPPLRVGIVPQQTPTRLARLWTPLLQELGRRAGVALDFHTAPSVELFDARVAAGAYDIVYVNPYKYPQVQRSAGYRAFAREERKLQGLIVVRDDNALHSIADLQGATVAFPGPEAFAATMLPMAQLTKEGIAVTPTFLGSHESVYLAVAQGLHPAGGGIPRTLEQMPQATRARLRVLWASELFTPHPFAAHPRVPRAALERLQRALVALGQDADGRALLQTLGFGTVVAAHDRDWDDIRGLRFKHLEPLLRGARP